MKSFSYTVKDELGIHARPAGMLVKEVKNFQSKVTLEKDGKSVDASRLMAVMGMGVKKDQTVTVTVEGDDEDAACDAIKASLKRICKTPVEDGRDIGYYV